MKKLFILSFLILMSTLLFAQLTVWPKNILAELFTTSQCASCPNAYAGLDMIHSQYDYSEFNSIRYYSSEGGGMYGSETVEPVYDYYGITFTPQVYFNGLYLVQGGTPDIGEQYTEVVNAHYFEASPIKLRIISFDVATGNITVGATLMNNDTDLTDAVIRFALIEDNVTELHTKIVRYISKSNFVIGNIGQEVTFEKTLQVSDEYNPDNLHAVSFVQLPDHTILQSVSTYQQPEPKIRVAVPFNPNAWDQNYNSSDPYYMYEGEFFPVINTGFNNVTVNVSVNFDSCPDGWDISFCDHSNCYLGTATVEIPANGEENYHEFHVVIIPTSEGEATYHFTVTVPGTDINYTVPFYYSTSASSSNDVINPQAISVLYPAYPNPLNGINTKSQEITFKYSVLEGNYPVTFSIYNIKGQKVKTLYSGLSKQGTYDIKWQLKDENGNVVSNGIYLYVLDVNGKKISKKLTVLK